MVDLENFLENFINSHRLLPLTNNINVNKKLDLPSGVKVSIEKTEFDRMLSNILSNSVKFSEKGSNIDIGAYLVSDNFVVIFIQDYGIGMDEITKDMIFSNNSKREGKVERRGVLWSCMQIIKSIAQRHDGELKIESKENFGTKISIKLSYYN